MSLRHRLVKLERRQDTGKPRVLMVQVPAGATEEQINELIQAEKGKHGIKDDDQNLVIYLLRFV